MSLNRKRKTRTDKNSKKATRSHKALHHETAQSHNPVFGDDSNTKIASFVVIGTTVTSVPAIPSRILEISLFTVKRKDVQLLNVPELLTTGNKLTLFFHPNRSIPFRTMEETDILNSTMEDESKFSENDFEMMHRFLNRLPAPICIISYDDQAILRQELQNIEKRFDKHIYYVILRKAVLRLCSPFKSYEIANVHRELCDGNSTEKRTAEKTMTMTVEILAKLRGILEWIDTNRDFFHK